MFSESRPSQEVLNNLVYTEYSQNREKDMRWFESIQNFGLQVFIACGFWSKQKHQERWILSME
jgi:hypothetical protein